MFPSNKFPKFNDGWRSRNIDRARLSLPWWALEQDSEYQTASGGGRRRFTQEPVNTNKLNLVIEEIYDCGENSSLLLDLSESSIDPEKGQNIMLTVQVNGTKIYNDKIDGVPDDFAGAKFTIPKSAVVGIRDKADGVTPKGKLTVMDRDTGYTQYHDFTMDFEKVCVKAMFTWEIKDAGEVFFTDKSTSNYPQEDPIVEWHWDFGGNDPFNESTDQNPTYRYKANGTYTIRLRVVTQDGGEDWTENTIHIRDVPDKLVVADFEITKVDKDHIDLVSEGHSYSSLPEDDPITAWHWHIQQGDEEPQEYFTEDVEDFILVNHVDAVTATLTVTTAAGETDSATKTYQPKPGVDAHFTWRAGNLDLSAVFHGHSVADDPTGNPIVHRHWDFGDGATDTHKRTAHDYTNAGGYRGPWTVTLTVTVANGEKDTHSEVVDFTNLLPDPTPEESPFYEEPPVEGCINNFDLLVPKIEQFGGTVTSGSVNASNGVIQLYLDWKYGDLVTADAIKDMGMTVIMEIELDGTTHTYQGLAGATHSFEDRPFRAKWWDKFRSRWMHEMLLLRDDEYPGVGSTTAPLNITATLQNENGDVCATINKSFPSEMYEDITPEVDRWANEEQQIAGTCSRMAAMVGHDFSLITSAVRRDMTFQDVSSGLIEQFGEDEVQDVTGFVRYTFFTSGGTININQDMFTPPTNHNKRIQFALYNPDFDISDPNSVQWELVDHVIVPKGGTFRVQFGADHGTNYVDGGPIAFDPNAEEGATILANGDWLRIKIQAYRDDPRLDVVGNCGLPTYATVYATRKPQDEIENTGEPLYNNKSFLYNTKIGSMPNNRDTQYLKLYGNNIVYPPNLELVDIVWKMEDDNGLNPTPVGDPLSFEETPAWISGLRITLQSMSLASGPMGSIFSAADATVQATYANGAEQDYAFLRMKSGLTAEWAFDVDAPPAATVTAYLILKDDDGNGYGMQSTRVIDFSRPDILI